MDTKKAIELIKTIKKWYKEKPEVDGRMVEKQEMYLSYDEVFGFIPKKEFVKEILETLFEIGDKKTTFDFDYSYMGNEEIESIYSGEYFKIIAEICKNYDEVKVKMKRDYPLWVETDDFIFILAPRREY